MSRVPENHFPVPIQPTATTRGRGAYAASYEQPIAAPTSEPAPPPYQPSRPPLPIPAADSNISTRLFYVVLAVK